MTRVKFLHMEQCSSLATTSAVLDSQSNQNGFSDHKGNKNIICTMMKYGETFYGRHTALNTSCSEGKIKIYKIAFENNEHTKD